MDPTLDLYADIFLVGVFAAIAAVIVMAIRSLLRENNANSVAPNPGFVDDPFNADADGAAGPSNAWGNMAGYGWAPDPTDHTFKA